MKETEDWTCPVCGEPCLPDDHCKHVYFDSQVFPGPLLKRRHLKVKLRHMGKAKPRSEAEHEQD